MKSPFPGMDPYLEARWSDVHGTLITLIKEALQPALPSGLRARSEERVLLEDDTGDPITAYRADVAVVRSGGPDQPRGAGAGAVATPHPVIIELDHPSPVDRFVKIIDTSNGNRVVTVIEVLSPWNKNPGRLNRDYLAKLDDYERAMVNVVEIDLLRGPRNYLSVAERHIPPERRELYLIGVLRAARNRWEIYPVSLRSPVPPIPVPLRANDRDVVLQLQPLLDRVYTAGGHDDIDYSKPPHPPLSDADEIWASELLRSTGKR